MKKLRLILLAAFTSGLAFSGDSGVHALLGLSPDGRHAAFEEYGIQDASGFAYANILILDVENNTHAVPSIFTLDENPEAQNGTNKVRIANLKKAQKYLKAFAIVEKSKLGTGKLRQVISRSPYEAHEELNAVSFYNRYLFGEYTFFLNRYELLLSTHALPCSSSNAFCDESGTQQGFRLDLKSRDRESENESTKTLQNDTRIPNSRAYALGYSIVGAYVFDPTSKSATTPFDASKSKIIVVLGVASHGFEGPDFGYMLVSGNLQ